LPKFEGGDDSILTSEDQWKYTTANWQGGRMLMDIVWFLVIGLVAGWLASLITKREGKGIVNSLIIGVVGAFLGGFLFRMLHLVAYGLLGELVIATVGAVIGPWGAALISIGLLVSVLGNYLSWSLLAAEVMFSAASTHTMPNFLARQNKNEAPVAALWVSNILIQAFLILAPFAEYAFKLTLKMTSIMTFVPYLLVAAYGLKLARTGETYDSNPSGRQGDLICGAIATIYAAGIIYAGGLRLLLFSAILYAIGSVLFVLARREQGKTVFAGMEWLLLGVILVAAVIGVYSLASGSLSI
jgi:arginine:ornithine antiporter/lysine permease